MPLRKSLFLAMSQKTKGKTDNMILLYFCLGSLTIGKINIYIFRNFKVFFNKSWKLLGNLKI